jgi:hypothetical protein
MTLHVLRPRLLRIMIPRPVPMLMMSRRRIVCVQMQFKFPKRLMQMTDDAKRREQKQKNSGNGALQPEDT